MSKEKRAGREPKGQERLNRIKRLVVIAMFSDDELMERFVFKGGNLIDLIYQVGTRASVDIDLSMADEFRPTELNDIRKRIEKNLVDTFRAEGYEVFDVTMEEKPENLSSELKSFWGGYCISFKLIEASMHARFSGDLDALRRNAVKIGAKGKFEIDISKFEYCFGKIPRDLEGYRIFVYSPAMVVCEKLRALCQQMPEYGQVVNRTRPGSARARDFFDIYMFSKNLELDLTTNENRALLRHIFEAKKVPLAFLDALPRYREFHRGDFQSVKDTVSTGVVLESFDFYFDYVIGLCARLKAFGDV